MVSLLAVAFALNGKMYGAFTCSQVGTRANWSMQQVNMLSRISARVSLTLASTSSHQLDTVFSTL